MFSALEVALSQINLTNAACCHSVASLENRDVEGVTATYLFRHRISIYGVSAERSQVQASYREKTINLHLHDNWRAWPFYFQTRSSGRHL